MCKFECNYIREEKCILDGELCGDWCDHYEICGYCEHDADCEEACGYTE